MYFGNSDNIPTTVTPTTVPSHTHSANDITSGTLPIARGGTDATSASSALSNLGGFPASGGTISGAVNITGKLDVQNNAMHIGSGSSGAKLNFGDGDYVYLYESTDDHLYIKADKGLHLQCGSNSSYDITVQHGSDAAISLLGGGSNANTKIEYGTFTSSSSGYSGIIKLNDLMPYMFLLFADYRSSSSSSSVSSKVVMSLQTRNCGIDFYLNNISLGSSELTDRGISQVSGLIPNIEYGFVAIGVHVDFA